MSEKSKATPIIVDGVTHHWERDEISFEEVIQHFAPASVADSDILYSVKYMRGHEDQPEGIHKPGTSIKIKELMVISLSITAKVGVTIVVEATPHIWLEKHISYEEVVKLEVPDYSPTSGISYAVKFTRGHGEMPEGVLSPGTKVKVKEGMKFNVSETGQS